MQKFQLIDFTGQNETDEYNRISFLVLLRPTFEKTTDNILKLKPKKSCKHQSENKKSNYFFPVRRNSITAEEKRDESCKSKRRKKTSQLFRD